MAEENKVLDQGQEEKVKVKTVNRNGKSLVQKALVVKSKKAVNAITDKEQIKKINEEKLAKDKKLAEMSEKSEEKNVVGDKQADKEIGKPDKRYELTIGLKDLLGAGCHLGHKISKTHPKAREFIYAARDGIEVLDLVKSLDCLEKACNYIFNAKRNGKQIILVGTKRQAREVVRRVAEDAGVPYVTDRWLGGTITNWEQIRKDIKKLLDIKDGLEKGKFTENTKKENLELKKESIRLEKIVGGLKKLDRLFDIIFVVDGGFERTAVKEAGMRKIKVVGMIDSDSNPAKIDFPIPANDDSVKSVTLIVEEIGKAIKAAGTK